jgi:hypothetical protein
MTQLAPSARTKAPPWRFRQLGGDRKELVLADFDAPHGRPRQKPIVKDKITARTYTVHYSGEGPPTRHIFGDKFEPWELEGRFMDRAGGIGYAVRKTAYVKGFVADKQEVTITWGDQLAARGFIDSFEASIESSGEVAWSLTISIDADDLLPAKRTIAEPTAASPKDYTAELEIALAKALIPPSRQPVFFKGSLFDLLSSLITSVTAPFAALAQLASQMQAFEKSLIGEIRRFRAGIGQLRTALIIFRDTYQDFRSDIAIEGQNAEASLKFWQLQSESASATLRAMAILLEADRAAAKAERGKMMGYYQVKDGDSWESISQHIYGGADRIDDLRTANGIEPGAAPVPGAIYQVPR